MKLVVVAILILSTSISVAGDPVAPLPADQEPFKCTRCTDWNQPVEPWRLSENSWYVGTKGLASVLIVDDAGLILIDGGLPQSAAQILENVRKTGHDPADIRWILNSHAHFDHAGGIAALARMTGARVAAGRDGVIALTRGPYSPGDPQAAFGESARYPSVDSVFAVDDGDVIRVGKTRVTAIATPGHAPGGMSWTWQSCDANQCRDVVYLDSLNAVSSDDYRFSDHPQTLAALRASIDRLAALPCDVAMAAHPDQVPKSPGNSGTLCTAYADSARERLEKRLKSE
ncbi:subclass B3 metallo-beta-lactamase [Dokdonella sp.]|uniref:subclass B3 metallo-beta-lactamase n=1 Tax=Dokdonella sp. TaxID=2291710 RepID=UPI0035271C51